MAKYVVPAVAAAASVETVLGTASRDYEITAVKYVPASTLTGQATNFRRLQLINKGPAGSGSKVVATKDFISGINAPANEVTDITKQGNPVVREGDILAWQSNAVGTGLADPGGTMLVTESTL